MIWTVQKKKRTYLIEVLTRRTTHSIWLNVFSNTAWLPCRRHIHARTHSHTRTERQKLCKNWYVDRTACCRRTHPKQKKNSNRMNAEQCLCKSTNRLQLIKWMHLKDNVDCLFLLLKYAEKWEQFERSGNSLGWVNNVICNCTKNTIFEFVSITKAEHFAREMFAFSRTNWLVLGILFRHDKSTHI